MKKNIPAKNKAIVNETIRVHSTFDLTNFKKLFTIVCAVFAFALYSNTIGHGFTVDDDTVMAKNKIVTKGPSAIGEILTTPYRKGFWDRQESLYRPMSLVMFSLEWKLSNGKPWLGHLINVILYSIIAALLFQTMLLLFNGLNILIPITITLLFISHPIHTEVVANIKSRDELLCFLFSIVSVYYLIKYLNKDDLTSLIFSASSFLLALFSKENALTMVAIFPITIFFFNSSPKHAIIKSTLFLSLIVVIYMVIRFMVLDGVTNFTEIQLINNSLVGASDFSQRLSSAFYINGRYLLLLFFPYKLSFDYSFNAIPLVGFADFRSIISISFILLLAYYSIKNFAKKDPIVYGILFYAVTISLVSNLFFLIEATIAERFLFLPSIGFCIAIPFCLERFLKLKSLSSKGKNIVSSLFIKNRAFVSVIFVITILFSVKTFSRNFDWRSNETLLSKDVQTYPESARIRYAYGSLLVIEKGLDEKNRVLKEQYLNQGIEQLEKGVSLLSSYSDAWFNLGMAYREKQDLKNAIRCFEVVRVQKPKKDADFYTAVGIAYGSDKQYSKAISDLTTAVELNPQSDESWNNLGMYYSEAGDLNKAIESLNKSLKLKTSNEQALYNLGNTYAKAGNYETAIVYYKKAIDVNPIYTDAWNNLGNSYGVLKDFRNALTAYKKLSEIEPQNPKAIHNMAVTYYLLGDSANANIFMKKAETMSQQGIN